jgi:DNA invertase Pin-like site-specific DNA recombinase
MPSHSIPSAEGFCIGYSYIRFSHPEQSDGDSVRRQTETTAEWCARNNVQLDKSLDLHHVGSAFLGEHRKNPDRNALAAFLRLIEERKVIKGSYLIVENLDRLSREEEVPACHLLTSILLTGVHIVQLKPSELVLTEKSPGWDIMRAVMELSRGHGESAIKSERIGKAWREKKKQARENGTLITHRLPAWIELKDGKMCLIRERAAVVRRIFDLAIAGYGVTFIVRKLTTEGVPAFGERKINKNRKRSQFSGTWNRAYIANILKDRRALGEFQPCKRDGSPDGPPIKNYFPAVVTEDTWHSARAGAEQRRRARGRTSSFINPFAGLIKEARSGGSYYCAHRGPSPEKYKRVLVNTEAAEGRDVLYTFPFATFEDAVLEMLREIDPREILEGLNGHDEVMALEGELGEVKKAIDLIVADMDAHGESSRLMARLRAKEVRETELLELLAAANQKAANPLSASWGEMQSLAKMTAKARKRGDEDTLLRLRTALRRTIESIILLVVPVPGKSARIAAVQAWFIGGTHRDFIILHKSGTGGIVGTRPSQWWAGSLADASKLGSLDLRRREHVRQMERLLQSIDVDELRDALQGR